MKTFTRVTLSVYPDGKTTNSLTGTLIANYSPQMDFLELMAYLKSISKVVRSALSYPP